MKKLNIDFKGVAMSAFGGVAAEGTKKVFGNATIVQNNPIVGNAIALLVGAGIGMTGKKAESFAHGMIGAAAAGMTRTSGVLNGAISRVLNGPTSRVNVKTPTSLNNPSTTPGTVYGQKMKAAAYK